MSGALPDHVERRLRRPPPEGCNVVPGSTPVVGLGDPRNATVATIGLNPNRLEFLTPDGLPLAESERRLETLSSLGIQSLLTAGAQPVHRAFEACNWYFERNPLRRWYDVLERVLNGAGVSYYRGTACHLTLVQWATSPSWGLLPQAARDTLLADGAEFLLERVELEHVELVLLNGRSVTRAFCDADGCRLEDEQPPIDDTQAHTTFSTGVSSSGARVVAWSTNLHAAVGVSEWHRSGVTERVASLAGAGDAVHAA